MALISEAFVVFFVMAVVADRLPLLKSMRRVAELSKLSVGIMGSDGTSDSEKQKLLLTNSAGIFVQSLKLSGLILLVLAAGYLLVFAGDFLDVVKTRVWFAYLETLSGIVISLLSFCSYFLLKKIYDRARL